MDDTQELSGRELDERVASYRLGDINSRVVEWHCSGSSASFCEWAGISLAEYGAWVQGPDCAPSYSEDDALAADLRREMASSAATIYHNPSTGKVSVAFDTGEVTNLGMSRASVKGDTEAEATARAYVKWKESQ